MLVLRSFSTRTRLFFLTGILCLFVGIVALMGHRSIEKAGIAMNDIYYDKLLPVYWLNDLRFQTQAIVSDIQTLILGDDDSYEETLLADIERRRKTSDEKMKKYGRTGLDSFEQEHLTKAEEYLASVRKALAVAISRLTGSGVPDGILLKPGKLTEREFDIVKKHPENGAKILNSVRGIIGDSPFFRYAMEIVRHHHERWDGRGYPDGLTGKAIPFTARLMAVADVYDALVSKRPYKRPFTHDEAVEIILDERGSHFDPYVVDVFLSCSGDFRDICLRFMNDNFD